MSRQPRPNAIGRRITFSAVPPAVGTVREPLRDIVLLVRYAPKYSSHGRRLLDNLERFISHPVLIDIFQINAAPRRRQLGTRVSVPDAESLTADGFTSPR